MKSEFRNEVTVSYYFQYRIQTKAVFLTPNRHCDCDPHSNDCAFIPMHQLRDALLAYHTREFNSHRITNLILLWSGLQKIGLYYSNLFAGERDGERCVHLAIWIYIMCDWTWSAVPGYVPTILDVGCQKIFYNFYAGLVPSICKNWFKLQILNPFELPSNDGIRHRTAAVKLI